MQINRIKNITIKKSTKIYMLILLWGAFIIQYIININYKDDNKLIEAFNVSNSIPLESNIDIWGQYSNEELSEKSRNKILQNIANDMGIKKGYELKTIKEDGCLRTTLIKENGDSKTILQLSTIEKCLEDGTKSFTNYLLIDLTLYENIQNILSYKEELEKICEYNNVKADSSVYLIGSFEGKLDLKEKNQISKKIFKELNAVQIEANKTEDIYTIYGYSSNISDYIIKSKEKININLAMNYDETKNKTMLYVAVPMISCDY